MNTYSPVRVGVAGATGYAGVELVRRLARHPCGRADGRHGLGRTRSRAASPALSQIWDAPVRAARPRSRWRRSTRCSWRCPKRCRPRSARRWPPRAAGLRSLGRVPAARHGARASAGIRTRRDPALPVTYGLTERYRARARAGAADRVRRLLSDGGDPGAAAAGRGRAARAGDHHRRQVRRLGRRQDADRTHALLRDPRQHRRLRRIRAPSWRRDRTGARHAGHVRAAPGAARPRHPRDDLRAAEAGRRQRGDYAGRSSRPTDSRRSCG